MYTESDIFKKKKKKKITQAFRSKLNVTFIIQA